MSRTQPAANAPRLPVDIAGLVAAKEEGDAGDLVGDPAAAQRVQMPDLVHRPAFSYKGNVIPVAISPGQMALQRTAVPASW